MPVTVPQEVADKMALAAQYYAGSLVGRPYRTTQFGVMPLHNRVDPLRVWRERAIVRDDCVLCKNLTDYSVRRRIAGYQGQIDLEVLRGKNKYYTEWLQKLEDIPEPGVYHSDKNRRRFVELFQDMITEKRPHGWELRPFPLVSLSMRHKRKLCVTWNHILLEWMEENGLHYDFKKQEFWGEEAGEAGDVPNPSP